MKNHLYIPINFFNNYKVPLFLGVLSLLFFQSCSYLPQEWKENVNILGVQIEEERNYIILQSEDHLNPKTAFIFYPGGLVDPHAYIKPLSYLTANGIKVIIDKMPANLAVIDLDRGQKIVEDFPEIEHWAIGGHSLGGAMACSLVGQEPNLFKALVLMAAYPAQSVDLTDWEGSVLSLFASNDGLASLEDIEDSKNRLPESMEWTDIDSIANDPEDLVNKSLFYKIEGGNHAQFGDYGEQKGDGKASISPQSQHLECSNAILEFFKANKWE